MAELTVENTYALALYEAASEEGNETKVFEDAKDLLEIIKANEEMNVILGSPAVSAENKKKMLSDMFEGEMAEELLNFLCILIDKRRMVNLEGIIKAYEKIYSHTKGEVEGLIFSTKPLSKEQLTSFEKETGKLIGESVKLENEIDESLIAGVKILIDGKIIDASYKTQLNKIAFSIRK